MRGKDSSSTCIIKHKLDNANMVFKNKKIDEHQLLISTYIEVVPLFEQGISF